jgi:hypothetical protein
MKIRGKIFGVIVQVFWGVLQWVYASMGLDFLGLLWGIYFFNFFFRIFFYWKIYTKKGQKILRFLNFSVFVNIGREKWEA